MHLHESQRIDVGGDEAQTLCWGWGAEQRHARPQQYRDHRNDVLRNQALDAEGARKLSTPNQPCSLTLATVQLGHHLLRALVGHEDVGEGGMQGLP